MHFVLSLILSLINRKSRKIIYYMTGINPAQKGDLKKSSKNFPHNMKHFFSFFKKYSFLHYYVSLTSNIYYLY